MVHRAPADPAGSVWLLGSELAALRRLHEHLSTSDAEWLAWVDGRDARGWIARVTAALAAIGTGLYEFSAVWTLMPVSMAASRLTSDKRGNGIA
jgi:hypothetical protein